MDPESEPWEIARDLSRKAYRILAAIRHNGGEARTSMITEQTEMNSPQVNHYYARLIDAELIERIEGREEAGRIPRQGYLYRITDRGRDVLSAAQENYDMTPLEEGVVRARLTELEGRTDQLTENFDLLVDDVGVVIDRQDDLRDDVDELRGEIADLQATVEDLIEHQSRQ